MSDIRRRVREGTETGPDGAARIPSRPVFCLCPVRHRQADRDAAMVEWNAAVASRLDFPETHLQIAGMALTMRALPI